MDLQLARRVAEVQNIVQSQQRVFRQLNSVRDWMARYGSGCHARKPLMVLTGPSGTGKSSYVRSLVPRQALLELNCSGVRHVHLTGFDPLGTRLIFWDELPAATVISHKKLFQHPPVLVDLGQSPTGAHVRSFWVADALSIICSNTWLLELEELPPADREWLTANTIIEQINVPMWVD